MAKDTTKQGSGASVDSAVTPSEPWRKHLKEAPEAAMVKESDGEKNAEAPDSQRGSGRGGRY